MLVDVGKKGHVKLYRHLHAWHMCLCIFLAGGCDGLLPRHAVGVGCERSDDVEVIRSCCGMAYLMLYSKIDQLARLSTVHQLHVWILLQLHVGWANVDVLLQLNVTKGGVDVV